MKKLVKLPALLTANKYKAGSVKYLALGRLGKIKNHFRGAGFKGLIETILAVIIIVTFIALLALIWFNIRPIKTADIKVPIATAQASYKVGEPVSGIFFGETYWTGEVRILREVFCKNYKGVIKPPAENADGDLFSTQTMPRKFEGETIYIGNLPKDVPIGSNCIVRFTNIYIDHTPFGDRRIEYQYYTQNFTIITPEQSDTKNTDDARGQQEQDDNLEGLTNPPSTGGGGAQAPTQDNTPTASASRTQEPEEPTQPPAEPVEPPRECAIDLLGIRLLCN